MPRLAGGADADGRGRGARRRRVPAPPALQVELRSTLADAVAVRDARTLAWMRVRHLPAQLVPDPALLVATLFGRRIARHAARGEPAQLRAAFPQGWIALQCSAVFGDDATLDTLAAAIAPAAHANALGVAMLRAGAAPWHDDAGVLHRLAARLGTRGVRVVDSLHLWDLCAVVAGARRAARTRCAGPSRRRWTARRGTGGTLPARVRDPSRQRAGLTDHAPTYSAASRTGMRRGTPGPARSPKRPASVVPQCGQAPCSSRV